jgi:hypothetical protein
LATHLSETEAASIVAELLGEGIQASAVGGLLTGARAEAPGGAKVVVLRRDLGRARTVLATLRSDAAAIDWDAVDVGEPEGGIDPDGYCYHCRYDLASLDRPDRCPECGTWLRGTPEPGTGPT